MRKIIGFAFLCVFFSVSAFAADNDYVMVTAVGSGTSRMAAVDQAWMEAVRMAVGAIVSGKTELNNDELTEKIILHSRGIVESYNVIDEKTDGKKITVTIEAKVHRVTLTDLTKTYGSTQTVKISAADAIKEKEIVDAKEKTADNKNKSGAELLEEVINSYEPGMFMTASIVPNVFFSKEKKTYSIEIIEKFNEDLFWKEFLPRLRQALDGVAISKTKGTYSDSVRTANQVLAKDKYLNIPVAIASYASHFGAYKEDFIPQQLKKYKDKGGMNDITPYMLSEEDTRKFSNVHNQSLFAVIPDNLSSYTAYEIEKTETFREISYSNTGGSAPIYVEIRADDYERISKNKIAKLFYDWFAKFSRRVSYNVSFLDDEGNELHVQPIKTGLRYITTYRWVSYWSGSWSIDYLFCFAPGFSNPTKSSDSGLNFLYLDTTNLKQRWQVDEFMNDEMDKVSSIKLEQIFE